ncbi:MAG: FimV/HubP family polar landmark protein [Oceanospirillaceae bacterium]
MLRKLGLSIAIASVLLVAKVHALGMGEIRVKSALNEPLHAEIDLFQVKNLSPLQIKSRMADLNDFALSGLATQRALSDVRFQIRVRANGTGRIILTSKLPVTEPFMNFLVEVNWPSGRLIREYTLLLDPPSHLSIQNNQNFARNATIGVNKVKIPKIASPKKSVKNTAPKPAPASQGLKKGQYYIGPKDTLWDIALATRPNKRITPQQMMVLIQRKNPQAFPNANINVMTARKVIDLPTQAEIDALSVKAAQDEVTKQTKLWKSGNLPKAVVPQATEKAKAAKQEVAKDSTVNKPVTDSKLSDKEKAEQAKQKAMAGEVTAKDTMAAAVDAQGGSVPAEKGMLDVVTQEEADKKRDQQVKAQAMALAASKDSEKIAELLKNNTELDVKLALSQESIDKLERDNIELNKKLNTIIKQLDDINRLGMLKDEQLAALQAEREEAEKDQQQQAKQEGDKSWLDRLLDNPVAMAATGIGWLLAVIAGIFLLLRRKKKTPDAEEASSKSEPTISLPDDVIAEDLKAVEELSELGDESEAEKLASDDVDDVDDLDLDLDLDMDMDMDLDLEESLDIGQGDDSIDDDDLAAELEAQLNTPSVDDDDDLEMLEGIDSLEFDLSEGDESLDELADELELDVELDIDEDLDQANDMDAEQQALAEFAAAMEEADPGALDEDQSADDVEIELTPEDEAAASVDENNQMPAMDAEEQALAEFAAAMEETDPDALAEDENADEVEIELTPEDELAISVEEDEVDINEINQVTSIDELEALELNEPLEIELDQHLDEDSVTQSLSEIDSELEGDSDLAEEGVDDTDLEDLEIELVGDSLEVEDFLGDQDTSQDDDSLDDGSLELESAFEIENSLDLEEPLEDEDLLEIENSLDDAATDIEEDIQIPMDDALGSLLDEELDDERGGEVGEELDKSESLNEQVDELLSSTDDEIAFEEVAPAFDAENENDIDLLSGEDGLRMKLDLARAYIEMGDEQGAADIISEVTKSGDEEQQREAQQLLSSMQTK